MIDLTFLKLILKFYVQPKVWTFFFIIIKKKEWLKIDKKRTYPFLNTWGYSTEVLSISFHKWYHINLSTPPPYHKWDYINRISNCLQLRSCSRRLGTMSNQKGGSSKSSSSRSMSSRSSSSASSVSSFGVDSIDQTEVRKVFQRFDANGDGKISATELTAILLALGSDPHPDEVLWYITWSAYCFCI
jgi:EF hand